MFEVESGMSADLPAPVLQELHNVGAFWERAEIAEGHLTRALMLAPDSVQVRIGAYKFYFYRNRLREALPHAFTVVEMAAMHLQLPKDWTRVRPQDAGFDRIEMWPGLYLQALIAYGYCLARLGDLDQGRAVLTKAAELDSTGRLGAARLLATVERGPEPADDED